MTIPEIIERCTCAGLDESEQQPARPLVCAVDGEPLYGFQEIRISRINDDMAAVARAVA